MTKEELENRLAVLTSAIATKNQTETLCHEGTHPHSYWTGHAVILQWSMEYLCLCGAKPEEQPLLRRLAVDWWDRAARHGRLLDC